MYLRVSLPRGAISVPQIRTLRRAKSQIVEHFRLLKSRVLWNGCWSWPIVRSPPFRRRLLLSAETLERKRENMKSYVPSGRQLNCSWAVPRVTFMIQAILWRILVPFISNSSCFYFKTEIWIVSFGRKLFQAIKLNSPSKYIFPSWNITSPY